MPSKSPTTTRGLSRPAVHPGAILREDLSDAGVGLNELARAIGVPTNRVSRLLPGERGVTADTARRLALFWGNSPEYWMNLQAHHELALSTSRVPTLRVQPLGRAS